MRSALMGLAVMATLVGPAQAEGEQPQRPTKKKGVIQHRVLVNLNGHTQATDLIRSWARASDRIPVIDPQIQSIKIHLTETGELDFATLRKLLDVHDVVVLEHGRLLVAHHRRNLCQREPPDSPVIVGRAPLPTENRLVTSVVRIEHGAGNTIFATVRGLLTRDTNRIGNILYVSGPETIIIVDLAPKVRYYRRVIRELDRPRVSKTLEVAVFEVPSPTWRTLQRKQRGEPLLAALRAAVSADGATLLEESSFASLDRSFSLERFVKEGDRELKLELSVGPVTTTSKRWVRGDLRLNLVLDSVRGVSRSKRKVTLPLGALQDGAHVLGFTLQSGDQPTHLVVALVGRR